MKLLKTFKKKINELFSTKDSRYYDLQELKKLQIEIVSQKKIKYQDIEFFISELKKFHHWLKFTDDSCSLYYNNLFLIHYLYELSGKDYDMTKDLKNSEKELQFGINFLLNEGYENFKLIRDCSYKGLVGETHIPFTATDHEIDRFIFPNNFLPFHNSKIENREPDILRSYHTDFFTIFSRENQGVHIAVNHNGFLKKESTKKNSLAKFDYGNVSVFYKGKMLFDTEKSNHLVCAVSKFWRHGKFTEGLKFQKNDDEIVINYYNGSSREICVNEFGMNIFDTGGMYSEFRFDTKLFLEMTVKKNLLYSADKTKIYKENDGKVTRLKMWGQTRFLTLDF
jgi:hypothetical protein